jgi:molybdopterin molybdotransferase
LRIPSDPFGVRTHVGTVNGEYNENCKNITARKRRNTLREATLENPFPPARAPELVRFDDARRAIVAACAPLAPQDVALGDAAGRTLRETLIAREDLVPYARSAMDGFALRAADARPGSALPIVGIAYAGGRTHLAHAPHTATAIATGAPIPEGADAVVPFERIERRGETIVIGTPLAPGDHIFPAGDDARVGDVLARAGETLGAGTLALLAAAGYTHVPCSRKPRVAILTTGEELVEIAQLPGFGQIRNSNSTLLAASLGACAASVVVNAHVRDDRATVFDAILRATQTCDVVVTTGGASVGEKDFVKGILDELGATYAFRSVALRPARPSAFATVARADGGEARVLALPGNPAAAFVGLHAFGIPALRALEGASDPFPRRVRARLRGSLHGKAARTYVAFVRLAIDDEGRLEAMPLDNQCSSLTRTASGAAGLAMVGPERGDVNDGDLVDVEVFAWESIAVPTRTHA